MRKVVLAVLVILLGALQAAHAQGTLRMALMALPPTKGNPHGENIDYLAVWSGLFDPMTMVTNDGQLIPWLATSWEQDSETSWVFTLRDGITYSNGRAFDADAVLEAVSYLGSLQGQAEPVGRTLSRIERAERVDDLTVRIQTDGPYPLLPYAIQVMRLPEPDTWRRLGRDGFAAAPVGTGPFVVGNWDTQRIALTARKDSWRAPELDAVELHFVRDPNARMTGLVTGLFDVIAGVDTDSFEELQAVGGTVRRNRVAAAMALMFNTVGDPRLQDPRLRQALNYAVNKELIIDVFFGGVTEPATQPAPRAAVGFNPELKPYPYDPDKARQLLAEAGYADGFSFVAVLNVDSALTQRVYQQVASDLSKVGVEMTLRAIPRPQYLKHFQDGEWGGSAFPAGYFTPTMDALETMRGGSCLRPNGWYCDPDVVPAIEAAMAEPFLERRIAMVQDLMAHAHETAHGLFLYEAASFTGLADGVTGYDTHGSFVVYEDIGLTR